MTSNSFSFHDTCGSVACDFAQVAVALQAMILKRKLLYLSNHHLVLHPHTSRSQPYWLPNTILVLHLLQRQYNHTSLRACRRSLRTHSGTFWPDESPTVIPNSCRISFAESADTKSQGRSRTLEFAVQYSQVEHTTSIRSCPTTARDPQVWIRPELRDSAL
jgi:hypothetical protein